MTYGVGLVVDVLCGLKVFLEPFPKGYSRFACVLLITFQPVTLVPVNYSAFMCHVIPIPSGSVGGFDSECLPLKWTLDPHFTTNVLEAFT